MDTMIAREISKFAIDIFRKPTYTDIIIPKNSCHPREQKMAAIRYLYNRLNTYQLSHKNMEKENNILQQILHNNGYATSTTKNLLHKTKTREKDNKKVQWVKFTYIRKETRAITKVFKNTNVNIAFSANNTLSRILTTRRHNTKYKY
jgi:hypothetical protein